MLLVLGALFAANLAAHLSALGVLPDWQLRATQAGVDLVVLVTLAAGLRVFGPLLSGSGVSYLAWLVVSGTAWSLAFALFLVAHAQVLVSPRVDGKPG